MTLIEKIMNMQNGQRSLKWGRAKCFETMTLFAVGHKSYPRRILYFVLDDLKVLKVAENSSLTVYRACKSESEVLKCIAELLKEKFPAKGVK